MLCILSDDICDSQSDTSKNNVKVTEEKIIYFETITNKDKEIHNKIIKNTKVEILDKLKG